MIPVADVRMRPGWLRAAYLMKRLARYADISDISMSRDAVFVKWADSGHRQVFLFAGHKSRVEALRVVESTLHWKRRRAKALFPHLRGRP